MALSKTYAVGAAGLVRRMLDGNGIWVNKSVTNSLPEASAHQMFDVMTDPNDNSKVFVVGEGLFNTSCLGVYVSFNAGDTWIIPNGTYKNGYNPATFGLSWKEVWVIDSLNIVICGENGYVAKSTDGGYTFNLCTQLPLVSNPFSPLVFEIPNVSSIHWINPNVGVIGTEYHVFRTINGGTSWFMTNFNNSFIPSAQGQTFYGIHLSSDGTTIVALASNYIFRSIDHGNTWSVVYTFPTDGLGFGCARHLTWTDDSNFLVVGAGGMRVTSTDGGQTWSVITAYFAGGDLQLAAHLYEGDNGYFGEGNTLYSTTNRAVNGIPSDTGYLPAAVWSAPVPASFYLLTPCDGGPTITVNNDLSGAVGQVIIVCPQDIIGNPNTNTTTPVNGNPISFLNIGNQTPSSYNQPAPNGGTYCLIPCCGENVRKLRVTNDLSGLLYYTINFLNGAVAGIDPSVCYVVENNCTTGTFDDVGLLNLDNTGSNGPGLNVEYYEYNPVLSCNGCPTAHPCGNVIPGLDECKCYTVSAILGEVNEYVTLSTTPTPIADCASCKPYDCYYLVDCANPGNYFVSNSNLEDYLNQIIKLPYNDICWKVLSSPNCVGAVPVPEIVASYGTCAECLPTPIPEDVNLNTRAIKPGYYTKGCPPEYTEKVNCNFASQYYQLMVSQRYGINFCCPLDLDKWDIEKSLLDLKALYDEGMCVSSLVDCCPPECVSAIITVFNPLTCQPPEDVTVDLDYPTECEEPQDVTSFITILPPRFICSCYSITIGSPARPSDPPPTVTFRPCGFRDIVTVPLAFSTQHNICSNTVPVVNSSNLSWQPVFVSNNCFVTGCPPD